MAPKYTIVPDLRNNRRITVHPDTRSHLLSLHRQLISLRYGIRADEAVLYSSPEAAPDEILITQDMIQALGLPLSSAYELRARGMEWVIGPYIGILAASNLEQLHANVEYLSSYLYAYEEIGGSVVAFSPDGVNPSEQTLAGYLYHPEKKEWLYGTYPYPSSIFKRTGMDRSLRTHFQSLLGDRVFNSYIFNKWEMHEWLEPFPSLRPYLPDTVRYEKASDVLWFLEQHNRIYIKPIYGSQGMGILEAERLDEGNGDRGGGDGAVRFRYQSDGEWREVITAGRKETNRFVRSVLKKHRYILQQSVELLKSEDRLIDFRILLVKDRRGRWKDMGMVGRFGVAGSIVSNISSGGTAAMGEDILRQCYGLKEEELWRLRSSLTAIAIRAAEGLEESGVHSGNLGIDLALTPSLHPWILEINNKDPNHTIAIDAGNRQLFYRTRKENMLYAKYLAGFEEEDRT